MLDGSNGNLFCLNYKNNIRFLVRMEAMLSGRETFHDTNVDLEMMVCFCAIQICLHNRNII